MSETLVGNDAQRTLRVLGGTALGVLPLKALFTDWGWLVDVWLAMAILILVMVRIPLANEGSPDEPAPPTAIM